MMPDAAPGMWHCFACNTDNDDQARTDCAACHRPRVIAPAPAGDAPPPAPALDPAPPAPPETP